MRQLYDHSKRRSIFTLNFCNLQFWYSKWKSLWFAIDKRTMSYETIANLAEPNIFLRICTHTQTIPISSDLCPPMSTHNMTCVHPRPPMLFKLRPCIKKLCNVYYPPTPSFGSIGQIKGRSLSWLQPIALHG